MDEATLAAIEAQIRAEVGEDWESDAVVLRGRDAVREEHGLPKIGKPSEGPSGEPVRRPPWGKLFGR